MTEEQEKIEEKKGIALENIEETVAEPECVTISDHMKSLVNCCKEFEEDKVDEGTVALKTLEFMQAVKKTKESGKSEETQSEETP